MTHWTIRRAEASDTASLAACIDAAYSVYTDKGIDLPAVSEGIAEDIRENSVWVAVLDGRIIGGLVLILRRDHAILANVAVDPSAAGSGLGRTLMDQAEQEARKLGLEKLKLSTHVDIPENVSLYEHLGWHEIHRSNNKVFMEKQLESLNSSS